MIIGIDVGLNGAICCKDNEDIKFYKIPTIKIENSAYTHWYDINKIKEIFNSCPEDSKIILEYQRPFEKQGVVSVFRLGRGFGLLEGLIYSRFTNISIVDPKTWQNTLYKKYLTKEESLYFKNKDHFNIACLNIPDNYLELFNNKLKNKNFKLSKLKTLYCLYKSEYIKNFDTKTLNNHDLVDSFMMCLYATIA